MNTTTRLALFAAFPLLLTNACTLTIQGGAPVSDPVAYAPPPAYAMSAPVAPRVVYVESAPIAPRPVMRTPVVATRAPAAVIVPRRSTVVAMRPELRDGNTAAVVAMQERSRAMAEAAERNRQQNRQRFAKYDSR
jgi:hypothetical protein